MPALPLAEGMLVSHKPVAKDEVTRMLKTTRYLTLPSGIRGQEYHDDEIVSCHLYGAVTPELPSDVQILAAVKISRGLTTIPQRCQIGFQNEKRGSYFLGIAWPERFCELVGEMCGCKV